MRHKIYDLLGYSWGCEKIIAATEAFVFKQCIVEPNSEFTLKGQDGFLSVVNGECEFNGMKCASGSVLRLESNRSYVLKTFSFRLEYFVTCKPYDIYRN